MSIFRVQSASKRFISFYLAICVKDSSKLQYKWLPLHSLSPILDTAKTQIQEDVGTGPVDSALFMGF